ncbi:MAG: AAA family ATPase, partial [Oscillospiraceae bacterium]
MHLKSLEIQGFKSFPDKTKINFNQGMTAVVGPNGSGKSNISDAMRWVMGEQSTKMLRGGKMEDVIFSGTATRKSQGTAVASLSFDNSGRELPIESDDVTITRKYYRSGDSEYLINGAQVRLKDLNELFMDTGLGRDGYSMIGQGKIAEIVGAKSKERREIFEEAAGISKYRYRKAEAEHKLEQAEENLLRLYDILAELEGRVEPLRVQSEKAAQFISLSEKKKSLEVSLWLKTLDKYKEALKTQENRYLIAKGSEEQLQLEIDRLEQAIQDAYDCMKDCLIRSEEYQTIKGNLQKRIAELTAEIAVKQNDIAHHEENISRMEQEMARQNESDLQAAEEISLKQKQIEAVQAERIQLREEREKKGQELISLNQQGTDVDDRLHTLNQEGNQIVLDLSRYQMTVLNLQNAVAEENQRLNVSKEEIEKLQMQMSSEKERIEELRELLTEIAGRKDSLT